MIDPLDLTWLEFLQFVGRYIDNIGQSMRWLPIVAFVCLGIEGKSQVQFWIDKEDPNTRQPMKRQLRQLLLASYRRRLLLAFLLSALSGAFFMSLLLS